jgi:exodeoxyribonuclease-5
MSTVATTERKLTEEQQDLFDYIIERLSAPRPINSSDIDTDSEDSNSDGNSIDTPPPSTHIVLNAPGGTGKTFFCKFLVRKLKKMNLKVEVLAPTHKAVSLFTKEGVPCSTIHRFLSVTEDVDAETGELLFNFDTTAPSGNEYSLIIVDECSMVSSDMLYALERFNFVLFMGDDHQLPPVKEKVSPVFSQGYRTFTFTKNMRIENNPDSLSALYLSKFRNLVDRPAKKINIENRVSLNKSIKRFDENVSGVVVLAWSNKQVDRLNRKIRTRIYCTDGSPLKKYYADEVLIFSGFRRTNKLTRFNRFLTYNSSDEVHIKTINTVEKEMLFRACECKGRNDKKVVKCVDCGIVGRKTRSLKIKFFYIIDYNDVSWYIPYDDADVDAIKKIISDFKKHCIKMASKSIWHEWHKLVNTYNPDLKYRYAMTIHKAQGSQWDYVFVDIDNIRLCRDLGLSARLCYTAVSRFQRTVCFLGTPERRMSMIEVVDDDGPDACDFF